MTAEDSQRLAQQFLNAFNEGDWERCSQLVTSDVVLEERTIEGQTDGVEGLIRRCQEMRDAAPGIRVDVNLWVTANDGSTVAGEVTWTRDDLEDVGTVSGTIFFSIAEERLRTIHELHAPMPERLNCDLCIIQPGRSRPVT